MDTSTSLTPVAEENPRLRELKDFYFLHLFNLRLLRRRRESQIKGIESPLLGVRIQNHKQVAEENPRLRELKEAVGTALLEARFIRRRRESQIKGIERYDESTVPDAGESAVAEENPRLRELKGILRRVRYAHRERQSQKRIPD